MLFNNCIDLKILFDDHILQVKQSSEDIFDIKWSLDEKYHLIFV